MRSVSHRGELGRPDGFDAGVTETAIWDRAREWMGGGRFWSAVLVLLLAITGTSLNIQSAIGTIMAVGVAVANAILLVTFAERSRAAGREPGEAAIDGARSRLRPILMTSFAMIAGMIPMALGLGEGGEQSAPLGRAVIGGLLGATCAALIILPAILATLQSRHARISASLDPDDPNSPYFESESRRAMVSDRATDALNTMLR